MRDLRWFGFTWEEGPDVGGPFSPYVQSKRLHLYQEVWQKLKSDGLIYPSPHSRKDVRRALQAPHQGVEEAIFPPSLRPDASTESTLTCPQNHNWRFRVEDGEVITFSDGRKGDVTYIAGKDFGDFIVWRKDGFPSYELAVVTDDRAMKITEVVRGEDLLVSTARQLLIYRALGWTPPDFFHCPLVRDETGKRMAKRSDSLSLHHFRNKGLDPADIRAKWGEEFTFS